MITSLRPRSSLSLARSSALCASCGIASRSQYGFLPSHVAASTPGFTVPPKHTAQGGCRGGVMETTWKEKPGVRNDSPLIAEWTYIRIGELDEGVSTRLAFQWTRLVEQEVEFRHLANLREYLKQGIPIHRQFEQMRLRALRTRRQSGADSRHIASPSALVLVAQHWKSRSMQSAVQAKGRRDDRRYLALHLA